MNVFLFASLLITITSGTALAKEYACPLMAGDTCAVTILENEAARIENVSWRDQTYREIAKLLAAQGETERAIGYVSKITTPDTKAMTIRGIGMAAAELGWSKERYDSVFTALRAEADKISDPPSYAIALTYIAMAQAFAGDDTGAWATAASMENDALRHKAYGETAEIQAERGDAPSAMKSISFIDSAAFRNKAYASVAKILTDKGYYEQALETALPIDNPYKKSEAITYILDKKRHEKLQDKLKKER